MGCPLARPARVRRVFGACAARVRRVSGACPAAVGAWSVAVEVVQTVPLLPYVFLDGHFTFIFTAHFADVNFPNLLEGPPGLPLAPLHISGRPFYLHFYGTFCGRTLS